MAEEDMLKDHGDNHPGPGLAQGTDSTSDLRDRKRASLRPGMLLIFVMLSFSAALLFTSRGCPSPAEMVIIYTAIAITTGVGFWILTDVDAQAHGTTLSVSWRITGSGAVGIVFVVVVATVVWMGTPKPSWQVFGLDTDGDTRTAQVAGSSRGLSATMLDGNTRFAVHFSKGVYGGSVDIELYLRGSFVIFRYRVCRDGSIRGKPSLIRKEEPQ